MKQAYVNLSLKIHAQLEASNPHRIQKENEGASAFPTPKAIPIMQSSKSRKPRDRKRFF